jgi:hypothetical protein
MFAGGNSPDLEPRLVSTLVKQQEGGWWDIPIAIHNRSSLAAEHTTVTVEIVNPEACEGISADLLRDASSFNPGQTIFIVEVDTRIFRGLDHLAGTLRVKMKGASRPRRVLNLTLTVYSTGMRARTWNARIQLAKSGFGIKKLSDRYLY